MLICAKQVKRVYFYVCMVEVVAFCAYFVSCSLCFFLGKTYIMKYLLRLYMDSDILVYTEPIHFQIHREYMYHITKYGKMLD